jgi:hypothetical protein
MNDPMNDSVLARVRVKLLQLLAGRDGVILNVRLPAVHVVGP